MKVQVCHFLVLVALLAPSTFAQSGTPTPEVSTGYSFLADERDRNRTGWVASLPVARAGPAFALDFSQEEASIRRRIHPGADGAVETPGRSAQSHPTGLVC